MILLHSHMLSRPHFSEVCACVCEGLIVAGAGPDVICQRHNEVLATPRWEDEQKQIPQARASAARSLSRLPFVCLSRLPPPAADSSPL